MTHRMADQTDEEQKAEQGSAEAQTLNIDMAPPENWPAAVYANHLVTQFTGQEIVVYGALVNFPLRPQSSGDGLTAGEALTATVQVRLFLPPLRWLDHLARSMDLVERTPVLKEAFQEIVRERARSIESGNL